MAVNHEVKGNLARLLATEDLVVEHKKVDTACFNVHNRVLTLPMWEKASSTVYDLLVGHEVGHALFTPNDEWNTENDIPMEFINLVEDARVEKFMKRKYPGLNKTFYRGYQELYNDNFFLTKGENLNEFNLADKANLYYKIGQFISLKFNEEEQEIINKIAEVETFKDVLEVAKLLYDYCKLELENKRKLSNQSEKYEEEVSKLPQNNPENIKTEEENKEQKQNSSTSAKQDENENENQSKNSLNQQYQKSSSSQGNSEPNQKLEVKTASSFENALKQLVNNDSYNENVYLEIPKVYLDEIIISNDIVHEICEETWQLNLSYNKDVFLEVDANYKEFKKSAQKEVNYLIKEFERKKSADAYSRASISKTGVLDCTKLHTYRYNEDIFKKVTTIPNGKSHGLIFVLDWSGSMCDVILDTIKQLYNLIWFCKKLDIPFEVYAFTLDWQRKYYDEERRAYVMPNKLYDKRENIFAIDDHFALFNFFTSNVNSAKLEKQMINVYRMAMSMNRMGMINPSKIEVKYKYPEQLGLSSTPLNESIIALHEIIPAFKNNTKVQKVHCIILTDGEAHALNRHVLIDKRVDHDPYVGVVGINYHKTFLRDRKLGTNYSFSNIGYYNFPEVLLRNLKDKFTDVSFIGMRILLNREINHFIRRYITDYNEFYKTSEIWRKQRSVSLKTDGYHAYFGISSTSLNNDVEFDVSENATKTQIKSAFTKSLKSKKMNKKILNEFIQLIS